MIIRCPVAWASKLSSSSATSCSVGVRPGLSALVLSASKDKTPLGVSSRSRSRSVVRPPVGVSSIL
jgi:hypothetical protein